MRPGRSPGAWSGSEFSSCFVDVVDNLAVAWCERSLRASTRSERTIEDCLGFLLYAPSSSFRRRKGGGERAMLPSVGAEHGVSSELLSGDPSGRPSPVQ
jgi:hypothetical protein